MESMGLMMTMRKKKSPSGGLMMRIALGWIEVSKLGGGEQRSELANELSGRLGSPKEDDNEEQKSGVCSRKWARRGGGIAAKGCPHPDPVEIIRKKEKEKYGRKSEKKRGERGLWSGQQRGEGSNDGFGEGSDECFHIESLGRREARGE
ncbi:hypothetical protein CRG98_011773 [Punica granatum]|uniref:Uncharacterized protein n=1 Tax=Punica granatum TaxID=22663 RepID=A0A2I0KHL9_PUNGR|nr:hypothetical protein CRG98_011773 [Punica granatum]